MTYTPVELRHVRVGRSLLGYKRSTVDQLIAEIADSFETTWRERGELADRVESLETLTSELRRREELLSHTLVAAETAAREVRDQAGREAVAIVGEARQEARAVLRSAQHSHERLLSETRRIEGMLRSALAMVGEGTAGARLDPESIAAEPPDRPEDAAAPAADRDAPVSPGAPDPWPEPAYAPATAEPAPAGPAPGPPAAEPPRPTQESPEVGGEAYGWRPDDTGELPRVDLPSADEAGGNDPGAEGPPVLRRIAGGIGHEFDWGEEQGRRLGE